MDLDSEIRENIEKVKDVSRQCVRNAGYYVVDTMEEAREERERKKAREMQELMQAREQAKTRLKECETALREAGVENITAACEEKKHRLEELDRQLAAEEKRQAQTAPAFRVYLARRKKMRLMLGAGFLLLVLGPFFSLFLWIPAVLLVVAAYCYDTTVVAKAETAANAAASAEYLEQKHRREELEQAYAPLCKLKRIEDERKSLQSELSRLSERIKENDG